MSQPEWKLVYATDYSALYEDTTGVYDPELVIAQTDDDADEDDIEATAAYVYRFSLERCWRVTEQNDDGTATTYLTDMDPARKSELPHPLRSYVPWYAKHLAGVASSIGSPVEALTDALCSDDPKELAWAYEAIGGHSGYENFDSYPDEWTSSEFAAWPERGVKLSTEERDAFTKGYIECALWCGVMAYKHDEDCPCDQDGTAEDCTCDAELVSSTDAGCDAFDDSDLSDDARKQLTDDAHEFYAASAADLAASTLTMERAGHDFWLTRNRHGAGFWDEGYRGSKEATDALQRLTGASHAYGSMDLLLDDNGKIGVL